MAQSKASRQANLSLSNQKLRRLRPSLFGWLGVLSEFKEFIGPSMIAGKKVLRRNLAQGDANAAILLELNPALVAAHSEDLDAITLLSFPPNMADISQLKPGAKLVAVNTYIRNGPAEKDLIIGLHSLSAWKDFHPLIGDLMSDDQARLDQLRELIPAEHWKRCAELVPAYRAKHPGIARNGRPGYGGVRPIFQKD